MTPCNEICLAQPYIAINPLQDCHWLIMIDDPNAVAQFLHPGKS